MGPILAELGYGAKARPCFRVDLPGEGLDSRST